MSYDPARPDPAYRRLPDEGPHAPALGGALITWVEPAPEHVVGYNRWYEDDHMITGAMVMPWMFACRRFVAPRALQPLRDRKASERDVARHRSAGAGHERLENNGLTRRARARPGDGTRVRFGFRVLDTKKF